MDVLPMLTMVIALILSMQFNRSRFSFVLLFLLAAAYSVLTLKSKIGLNTSYLINALLFLNMLIFSFFKDRSLFSIHGFLRLMFLALQAGIAWYILQYHNSYIDQLWQISLFTLHDNISQYAQIPNILLLIGMFACFTQLILVFIGNQAQAAFFACQIGLLGITSTYDSAVCIPLLLIACSLILCISILIDSHDMAYKDELTSLPSRRALNQLLLSLGRRYSIAMLDIDHFKKFNDTHGHDVGDEVLRMVASKIARVTGGGKPFRYGGEEFTVVFPGKSPDQVEAHLDALRKTIENYQMLVREKKRPKKDQNSKESGKRGKSKKDAQALSVTISIGLAERNTEQKKPVQVIKAADEALYRAKKRGRNCVMR